MEFIGSAFSVLVKIACYITIVVLFIQNITATMLNKKVPASMRWKVSFPLSIHFPMLMIVAIYGTIASALATAISFAVFVYYEDWLKKNLAKMPVAETLDVNHSVNSFIAKQKERIREKREREKKRKKKSDD